jgi:preprotein translocase subunit SecY
MIIVWLSSIDNKGIGQGTSLIIFYKHCCDLNYKKNLLNTQQFDQILLFKLRSYYS